MGRRYHYQSFLAGTRLRSTSLMNDAVSRLDSVLNEHIDDFSEDCEIADRQGSIPERSLALLRSVGLFALSPGVDGMRMVDLAAVARRLGRVNPALSVLWVMHAQQLGAVESSTTLIRAAACIRDRQ